MITFFERYRSYFECQKKSNCIFLITIKFYINGISNLNFCQDNLTEFQIFVELGVMLTESKILIAFTLITTSVDRNSNPDFIFVEGQLNCKQVLFRLSIFFKVLSSAWHVKTKY